MIPAKDVMTTDVISIRPETPIIEAINLLLEKRISGLPVVDGEMNLVGVVSEKDFLNILFQDKMSVQDPIQPFMSKKVISFKEEDDVIKVCECFIRHPIRRVPIVKDGKLAGVISRRDVLRLILETVRGIEEGHRE